ncbi:MAG TPA: thioredoxin [Acidimicrobiales bacterium]|nr:thioredoxin [Acidimicrobiales bacterium]
MTDVTDATFATAVIERSRSVPVVVDLWAAWCGPCKTLTPTLEKVVAEMGGSVELAKVDVDANPQVARAFAVQSIPSVFALKDGQVVDSFVGALPEKAVREFITKLAPAGSPLEELVAAGDEVSLRRALEIDPGHAGAASALGEVLLRENRLDELAVLVDSLAGSVANQLRARLQLAREGVSLSGDVDLVLEHLLDQTGVDPSAKDHLLVILDALGPEDPRYVSYRRRLANRLY